MSVSAARISRCERMKPSRQRITISMRWRILRAAAEVEGRLGGSGSMGVLETLVTRVV